MHKRSEKCNCYLRTMATAEKGTLPPRPPLAPPPILARSPASSPVLPDNRGGLLHRCGEPADHRSRPADYRHSLAGPVLLRRAAGSSWTLCGLKTPATPHTHPPPPPHTHSSPPLFCIVCPCLTDTEPIIISFPQGPAPFVWQSLQTVSIPSLPASSPPP